MVQLLTFKFFQLAWVSRRELLVSQNSKAKPKEMACSEPACKYNDKIRYKYQSHAH